MRLNRQHTSVVMKDEAEEQTRRVLRLKPAASFPSLARDDVSLESVRDGDTCGKATQQVLNGTCVRSGVESQSALIPVTLELFNPPSEEKQTLLCPSAKHHDVLLAGFRRWREIFLTLLRPQEVCGCLGFPTCDSDAVFPVVSGWKMFLLFYAKTTKCFICF